MLRNTFTVLFLLMVISIHAEDKKKEDLVSTDSTQIKMESKLSFYQDEFKKNNEAIQLLEKELEQRKAYNERLTGAIAATQEMLMQINNPRKSN